MGAKVHYEDNLFFLHSILRNLDSGLRLDLDPEYFRDKILEDIFFIDATLMRTFSSLKNNGFLIHRSSYLRSLRRTVRAYIEFLQRLREGELGFSDLINSYHDRLESTLQAHQKTIQEIDSILDHFEPDEEASNVISSQEYGFLLSGNEPDEDQES